MTQSQGVNRRAGQSAVTEMGLHADGPSSPLGVNQPPLILCVCVHPHVKKKKSIVFTSVLAVGGGEC